MRDVEETLRLDPPHLMVGVNAGKKNHWIPVMVGGWDAGGRLDRPDRKSWHLGTGEGKRACDLHSPPALPNLVSAASRLSGSFPTFPRLRERLVVHWGHHPKGRVTDSKADLAD